MDFGLRKQKSEISQDWHQKFEELNRIISGARRFLITSHVHTDGDAIGSVVALYHYLKQMKKQVHALIPGHIPARYRFLNTADIINSLKTGRIDQVIRTADVILLVDLSAMERLDKYYSLIRHSSGVKVCIDHHPFRDDGIDLLLINQDKVATAEIIYDYFRRYEVKMNAEMALALYTAILSDSGSFRFQRTSPATFRMAADLMEFGIDPAEIYQKVYEQGHRRQLIAWGNILTRIKRTGNICWVRVDKAFMGEHRIRLDEIDGVIDIMRKDGKADVVIVFVEKNENDILVGLRSRDGVNVGRVAEYFSGGGHHHAAGFSANEPLDRVIKKTLALVKEIQQSEGKHS